SARVSNKSNARAPSSSRLSPDSNIRSEGTSTNSPRRMRVTSTPSLQSLAPPLIVGRWCIRSRARTPRLGDSHEQAAHHCRFLLPRLRLHVPRIRRLEQVRTFWIGLGSSAVRQKPQRGGWLRAPADLLCSGRRRRLSA